MTSTFLIGLGHKARHGKNAVGDLFVSLYGTLGISAKTYSFAEALYDLCRREHGMTEKDAPLLQRIGLTKREEDPDYWVKLVLKKIEADRPQVAIITDARFPNEAALVQDHHGFLVKVERFNADGSLFVDPSRPADHISETALDHWVWDSTIRNDAGLDMLTQRAALVFGQSLYHYYRRLAVRSAVAQ